MAPRNFHYIAIVAAVVSLAHQAHAVEPSRLTPVENRKLVDGHNRVRSEVGVPPIAWSPKLATFAQAWADELARTGKFEHRPAEGEWARRYGENIAIGFGDTFDVRAAVTFWSDERESYKPGEPIPADLAAFKAGHYTQMVWRTTTAIGAGKAVLQTGERKGWTVIVCNYDPPGNVTGETAY
jgi:pathogenesis-related protein 1